MRTNQFNAMYKRVADNASRQAPSGYIGTGTAEKCHERHFYFHIIYHKQSLQI